MAEHLVINIDKAKLGHQLNGDNGEIGHWLKKRGDRALSAAKRQVGVKTGGLRNSIRMSHLTNSTGQYLTIWTMHRIAAIHHNGTRPHIITPKQGNKVLRFTRGAQVVYARRVRHPGTKPNRFLADQLVYFIP